MLPPGFGRSDPPPRRRYRPLAAAAVILLGVTLLATLLFNSTPTRAAGPVLAVALHSAGRPRAITLAGLDLVLRGAGTRLALPAGPVTLRAGDAGIILPDGRTWASPIDCAAAKTIGVDPPGRSYPGRIRLHLRGGGLEPVNLVELESYLPGVVAGELGDAYPFAALCAQAVAARSYALWTRASRLEKPWHLGDTTRHQVYLGAVPAEGNATRAVTATAGMVLLWQGRVLPCWYHSTCGGGTTAAHRVFPDAPRCPPLAGAPCTTCSWAQEHYRWRAGPFAPKRILHLFGLPRNARILSLDPAEDPPRPAWWRRARLVTTAGNKVIPAARLRQALQLKSTRILAFSREAEGWYIQGGGWGHGVGLCQNGACGLANRGRDWPGILSFYFPGSTLARYP